jgi:hypothetical protein
VVLVVTAYCFLQGRDFEAEQNEGNSEVSEFQQEDGAQNKCAAECPKQ